MAGFSSQLDDVTQRELAERIFCNASGPRMGAIKPIAEMIPTRFRTRTIGYNVHHGYIGDFSGLQSTVRFPLEEGPIIVTARAEDLSQHVPLVNDFVETTQLVTGMPVVLRLTSREREHPGLRRFLRDYQDYASGAGFFYMQPKPPASERPLF